MESVGIALFFALSASSSDTFLEELNAAKGEKKLADEISNRSLIEAMRRLKRLGIRFISEEL
jgi:hypothetical protein